MWSKTKVTTLLNIDYPIIQGPFGGRFSTANLASTVSNLGGMGSFGLNAYHAEEIEQVSLDIQKLTSKPYALNLWVPLMEDPVNSYTPGDFEMLKQEFTHLFGRADVKVPDNLTNSGPRFENQIEALLKSAPSVASFIYGMPSKEIIRELIKKGAKIIGTATTVDEAQYIEEAGADIVVATGNAAGGHRAAFLDTTTTNFMDTKDLVKEVLQKVKIPVVAAGGITTSEDIAKMLELGAGAVQLGTVFLATDESGASDHHKQKLLEKRGYQTTLTKIFTGRYGRVINTPFIEEFKDVKQLAPYPLQSSFLAPLRSKFEEEGNHDLMAYWAGQPTTSLQHQKAAELFTSLVKELNVSLG